MRQAEGFADAASGLTDYLDSALSGETQVAVHDVAAKRESANGFLWISRA